jgi:uncharacterized protein (TIGR02757 family)
MKERLDRLYFSYNRKCFIHPDPLECVYRYEDLRNREIAAVIASAFAFGRVSQILLTLDRVLGIMGPSPYDYLIATNKRSMQNDFNRFVYRFVRDRHVVDFLAGIKQVIDGFGSLDACFAAGLSRDDETVVPAMAFFVKQLTGKGLDPGYLVADPLKGSACKRMNLLLRWMVRSDDVDPGGWNGLPKDKLVIPLDTHMHRISLALGLTARKQGNMKTAVDVTRSFGLICPDDPVKYDFALTRFGIRTDMKLSHLYDTMRL